MESKEGFLGEKFTGYQVAPAQGVWAGIEAELDGEEKKRRAIIWWFVGAAAGLAAIFTVLNLSGSTTAIQTATIQPKIEINGNQNLFGLTDESTRENLSKELAKNKTNQAQDIQVYDKNSTPVNNNIPKDFADGNIDNSATLEQEENSNTVTEEFVFEEPSKMDLLDIGLLDISLNKMSPKLEIEKVKNPSRWFHEFSINSWRNSDNVLAAAENLNTQDQLISPDTNALALYSPISPATYKRVKPIGLNYHLGLEFGKRFEARTGLGLNYFYERSIENDFVTGKSHQLSASIPLSVRVNFNVKRRIQFFTEGGGVIELPFYRRTETFSQLNLESTDKSSVFNLSAAPGIVAKGGIKYMLNDRQSISLSPEVRYYFNSNKLASTAGSTKPVWFGLDLAFRF